MRTHLSAAIVALCLSASSTRAAEPILEIPAPSKSTKSPVDPDAAPAASSLKAARDPISAEMSAFRTPIRDAFTNRKFDELEKTVAALRASKETFGNGRWKIVHFYLALECRKTEAESMWQAYENTFQAWISAHPDSIAARVGYAEFYRNYAWLARGSGYADSVTEEGADLFEKRLAIAHKILKEARALKEKDPYWWTVEQSVALGLSWDEEQYDALMKEAHAFEPKFWTYDTARAFSLLPKWHGEPGDWEKFAEQTAARPDGLGAEGYARIVMFLQTSYDNIFSETKASWPKTREGLVQLRKKYPDSLEVLNQSAFLAWQARDRALARELFQQLGDTYLAWVWTTPENFVKARQWASEEK